MFPYLAVFLVASALWAQEPISANAKLVSFPGPIGPLQGFLYVPDGKGPFPAGWDRYGAP